MSQQVLIFNSDLANSEVFQTCFEDLPGWDILTTHAVPSILNTIIVGVPELVILTYNISELDDLELLKAIKFYASFSFPFVVFIDKALHSSKQYRLIELGVSNIVYKPCVFKEVSKNTCLSSIDDCCCICSSMTEAEARGYDTLENQFSVIRIGSNSNVQPIALTNYPWSQYTFNDSLDGF